MMIGRNILKYTLGLPILLMYIMAIFVIGSLVFVNDIVFYILGGDTSLVITPFIEGCKEILKPIRKEE